MKKGRYFGQSKRHTFNELADEYQPHAKEPRASNIGARFWSRNLDASPRTASPSSGTGCLRKKRRTLLLLPTGDTKGREAAEGQAQRPYGQPLPRGLSVCMSYGVKNCAGWNGTRANHQEAEGEKAGCASYLMTSEAAANGMSSRHQDLYLAVVLSLTTGRASGNHVAALGPD